MNGVIFQYTSLSSMDPFKTTMVKQPETLNLIKITIFPNESH